MTRDFIHRIAVCLFAMLLPASLIAQVMSGAERKELYVKQLRDKQIGIVANNASVVGGVNIVDVLVNEGIQVKKIFSPEHGFRMSAEAGATIENSVDSVTNIPVISLYGSHKKPTASDLSGISLIVFDLQDAGTRFYTYISTLSYVMEACAEQHIPVIVFDRPNPNGFYIDGPVLEKKYASFVGLHPVPVVYGMTIGEYARMVNGEGWLKNKVQCDLEVIPLYNYSRQTRCTLQVRPSPNLPNMESIYLYPSLCFFEGTNISIGRGTDFPFQVYGHPDLTYGDFVFTPKSVAGASVHPPQEGKACRGEDLRNYFIDKPEMMGQLQTQWLIRAYQGWRGKEPFFNAYFEKLAGSARLREQIVQGKKENEIRASWKPGIEKFKKIRKKYLLY